MTFSQPRVESSPKRRLRPGLPTAVRDQLSELLLLGVATIAAVAVAASLQLIVNFVLARIIIEAQLQMG